LLSQYSEQHPEVQVKLREATSDVQIDALLDEEIDAGFVIPPRGARFPSSLSYLPLVREPLVLVAPETWQKSGRLGSKTGKVDFASLLEAPLILFPRRVAPAFHDAITGYYASFQAVPRYGQEAIQMQTIVSLVSAGMGITLAPESLRNLQRTGVVYRELKGNAPQIETGLVWRKRHSASALREFVSLARRAHSS
jgi:DNA-binding transcriptional LysR family regulator